jgi:outer membrane protein TolC
MSQSQMNRLSCFLFLSLFSSATLAGENALSRSQDVDLSTLANTVYEAHPAQLNNAVYSQRIIAYQSQSTAYFPKPAVINLQHKNDVVGSSDGFQEWEAGVEFPLWEQGQQAQYNEYAEQLSKSLPAYQQQLKLVASGLVRESVWGLMHAEIAILQTNKQIDLAEALANDIDNRVTAGDLPATEKLLIQTHLMKLQRALSLHQSQLDYALKHYFDLTKQTAVPEQVQEDETANDIVFSHPMLAMQLQKIAELKSSQALTRFSALENKSVSVGVKRERGSFDDNFNHSFGVGFSMPLDNDTYVQDDIAEVAVAVADAEIEFKQLETNLKKQLTKVKYALASKQKQLVLVEKQYETAKQYFDVQKRSFDLGELDLNSLLRSQELVTSAEYDLLKLKLSIQQNIADINQAAGVIL